MRDREDLPPWGARARRVAEICSLPVGLSITVNALHAIGIFPALGSRPVAIVAVVVISVAVAGVVAGGLLWLAAEVVAGFRGSP